MPLSSLWPNSGPKSWSNSWKPVQLILLLTATLLALCLPGLQISAAEAPLSASDSLGYLDFQELGLEATSENIKIEINLQDAVLAFVTEALRPSDAELADALAKIRSIHFQLIQLDPSQREAAGQRARELADRLEGQGWQRIVRIQQDGILSYLHLLMQGNQIHGLTVMFLQKEDNQFGFINLAGEIDPAQLGRIGQRFDIDVLERAQHQLGVQSSQSTTEEEDSSTTTGDTP